MTKRRGHGEGSIYKRADGRWAGALDLGWQDGLRRRRLLYGKTRREVVERLAKLRYEHQRGLPVIDDRRALSDFLHDWLDHVVRPSVRPRTLESYRWVVDHHVVPTLGGIPLNRLGPSDVQQLISRKIDQGLSRRSVEYVWQVLRRALRVAMTWGLVTRNVAELASPPRPSHEEVRPLPLPEIQSVLEAVRGDRLEAAFVLALTCGLRRGEILALHWDDLALDAAPAHLRVRSTLQRVAGRLSESEPKSDRSRRTVSLPRIAADALRRRRTAQAGERLAAGDRWQDQDFVFTTTEGAPVDPRNFLRSWHLTLDRIGLPRTPLHQAPHGAASLMLSEGVPLKVVQETLGHSTIRRTADLYGHLMPGDVDRAAEAIDRALGA